LGENGVILRDFLTFFTIFYDFLRFLSIFYDFLKKMGAFCAVFGRKKEE